MLQMSGTLELHAAKLRRQALSVLLGTVSGTATSNLWKLLESYFGVDEDPGEAQAAEAASLAHILRAQQQEREQDKVVSMQAILQRKADQEATPVSSSEPVGAAKRKKTLKEQKSSKSDDDHPNKCELAEAQLYFPTDLSTMHQTGVPDTWIGDRSKLSGYKGCYPCMGEECDYIAQTRGILCSHVRRVHLGIALGCRYCPEKCWWQARSWSDHMDKSHPDMPKFEVVSTGSNVVSTTQDAELYVSEETIVIPAPGSIGLPLKVKPRIPLKTRILWTVMIKSQKEGNSQKKTSKPWRPVPNISGPSWFVGALELHFPKSLASDTAKIGRHMMTPKRRTEPYPLH